MRRLLLVLCAWAGGGLLQVEAALVLRGRANETFVGVDSTRSFNFYIGVQEIAPTRLPTATPQEVAETQRNNLTARYLSIERDQASYCAAMAVNGSVFASVEEARRHLLIIPWGFDFMCDGRVGIWGTQSFALALCRMEAPMLWLVSHNTMFMEMHDGAKFASWYQGPYGEQMRHCFFAIGLPDTESELAAMRRLESAPEDFTLDVNIEWTELVGIDKSLAYTLCTEAIPGVCFVLLAALSANKLWRILKNPHRVNALRVGVLLVDFLVAFVVGLGRILLAAEILPSPLAMYLLTSFSMTGVGTSILVWATYDHAVRALRMHGSVMANRNANVLLLTCFGFFLLNVAFGTLFLTSTTKNAVLRGNIGIVPIFIMQGIVSLQLLRTVNRTRSILRAARHCVADVAEMSATSASDVVSNKEKPTTFTRSDRFTPRVKRLEARIGFWVRVSAIGAVISVGAYMIMPFFWVGRLYLVLKAMVDLGRIVNILNILAEIHTCAPTT